MANQFDSLKNLHLALILKIFLFCSHLCFKRALTLVVRLFAFIVLFQLISSNFSSRYSVKTWLHSLRQLAQVHLFAASQDSAVNQPIPLDFGEEQSKLILTIFWNFLHDCSLFFIHNLMSIIVRLVYILFIFLEWHSWLARIRLNLNSRFCVQTSSKPLR